jgi:hypothetical protein
LLESQKEGEDEKKKNEKNCSKNRRGRRRELKWNNAFNEIAVGVYPLLFCHLIPICGAIQSWFFGGIIMAQRKRARAFFSESHIPSHFLRFSH